MSPVSFVRPALAGIAVAFVWAGASAASAADVAPPPGFQPPVYGAPVTVGSPGCESCQHGLPKGNCDTCGKSFGKGFNLLGKDKKAPYPVTLCPGSCFGYFQTQWRKWDEVCPYPYLGVGVSDAGRLPGSMIPPPPPPSGGLAPPRPLDPKMTDPKMPEPKKTGGLDIPPIPTVPTAGKFGR